MSRRIQPRTLKGFRDFLPETMMPREQIMETARRVYRRYGFSPIDTPVLEYLEILTGKGSEETDRQMYRFQDHGGREVGMRFDLTVPLARFAAQHIHTLGTPFKRYHIAPVWRGESPQAGRFREFVQCDFDTIGTESVVADIETALVIHELLLEIGIANFKIKINNRQVLSGLLQKLELSDKTVPVLRSLDKLDKIGRDAVCTEMQAVAEISAEQANQVLKLAEVQGSTAQILTSIEELVRGNETGELGIERLRQITQALEHSGVPSERYQLDVAVARGLDYYTGVIFETMLGDLPSIGSICSGGRYDNLADLYTKQHLPGIGASLGLDRLLAAMETLKMIQPVRTPAPVLIAYFDKERLNDYLLLAKLIRSAGIGVELFPDPKKLAAQLKYADSRGFQVAIIAGSRELDAGLVQVKDLANKTSQEIAWRESPEDLLTALRDLTGIRAVT
ncbi:histidine--tRNA ligase [Aureliella helgolandensis]|uniref:Histidine--tRNA ligase n=1 Tax=Aureliella helgolandensis TaxID=2527968 RepID=A0A518G992_9BACT|nr:histidine--tRNA ligase [Aureliella helgolandensis]QDV25151.1 Histidine--tRNA ligase [Aureliella helgolandensis]